MLNDCGYDDYRELTSTWDLFSRRGDANEFNTSRSLVNGTFYFSYDFT